MGTNKADEYIKQFLPHVDTTGHWIGCIDGFKQRQSEIDELTKACEYKDRLYKGLNGMLQEKENEVLELTKEVERLRKERNEELLEFIDWFGTWQEYKNLSDYGINDILHHYLTTH